MIRKISNKIINTDDKCRKNQNKTKDNEYYLPHPQVKIVKLNHKDTDSDIQRQKIHLKYNRKQSYNPTNTITSVPIFKIDSQNLSKEQTNNPNSNKNYSTKKVQVRKLRSTSNGQTPKKPLSKSTFKLLLNNRKSEGITKRINLQIETPTTKKTTEKINLQDLNYDSYYSNRNIIGESKSIKTLKKPQLSQTMSCNDLQQIYTRCKSIIEQYEQQLQTIKRQNAQLQEQNRRLKIQKSPQNRVIKD